jgi:hypothetical protein
MARDPFLQNLWRNSVGLPDLEPVPRIPSLEELRQSEWSPQFETLMRNRLIMGRFRYGALRDTQRPQYNRLDSIEKRLNQYRATGNDELLVDIANLCLVEFELGDHPLKHFHSADDSEHVSQRGSDQ